MKILTLILFATQLLPAQNPELKTVYLRAGGPDGFTLTNCSNTTPVVCSTAKPHGLQPGDVVVIANVLGNTAANGGRKVKQVLSPTSFSLITPKGTDVAGNSEWRDGGLPGNSDGPVYGGKAVPYQLKPHPRVWLDGPTGELSRRIALTTSNGLVGVTVQNGLATVRTTLPHLLSTGDSIGVWNSGGINGTYRIVVTGPTTYTFPAAGNATYSSPTLLISSFAHSNNPAWGVITQNTKGSCIMPTLDAIRWYIDRSQTISLKCAKDTLINIEGRTNGHWGYGGAFPVDESRPYGGNVDTDYVSGNMFEYSLMWELIRTEFTAAEKKLILDKILNDLDDGCTKTQFASYVIDTGSVVGTTSAQTVLTGLRTNVDYANTEVAIVSGLGKGQVRRVTLFGAALDAPGAFAITPDKEWSPKPDKTSTYEIRATVSASGTTVTVKGARFLSHPDPGRRLKAGDRISTVVSEVSLYPTIVSVVSDTVLQVDRAMTWKDARLYYWHPWTPGTCGMVWFSKHHPSSPASHPSLYPGNGGTSTYGISPHSNTGMSKVLGDISLMLALADEDPRAAKRLEEVWAYYYDNNFRFALNTWAGYNQSGSYYGIGRTMWMPSMISWMMMSSVDNFPDLNLRDNYATESLRLLMYNWLPNSTSSVGGSPFHAWWGSENGNTKINGDSGLQRPMYAPNLLANSRNEVGKYFTNWLRNRFQYQTAMSRAHGFSAFFFVDPNAPDTDYTQQPRQHVFSQTSLQTCASLGLTCDPGLQVGGFVSMSDWKRDKGTHLSGYVNDWIYNGNPDHSVAEAGNYRIWKGRPLVGVDGSSADWPESLATSGEDLTKRGNLIEIGGAYNIDRARGDASIARWAGPRPAGDAESRYSYLMLDLTKYYQASASVARVQRHIAHFKKTGTAEVIVIYDDIETTKGTTHRGQVHYQQNGKTSAGLGAEGMTQCAGAPGCAALDTTRLVESYSASQWDTGIATRFFDPTRNSLRVYVDNADGTYAQGRGNTFRVSYCSTKDGGRSCDGAATATEAVVVHRLVESRAAGAAFEAAQLTLPEQWTGIKGEDKVMVFARKGKLQSDLEFVASTAGPTQYLIAGLAPGSYLVQVGATVLSRDGLVVSPDDNTLYFEGPPGGVRIKRVMAAGTLSIETPVLAQTLSQGDNSAELPLRVTGESAARDSQVYTNAPWIRVAPVEGGETGARDFKVILNSVGMEIGTYTGTVFVDSREAVNGRQEVKVYLTVAGASSDLTLMPQSVAMTANVGAVATARVAVGSPGTGNVRIQQGASGPEWLRIEREGTATPFAVRLTADTQGLQPGVYMTAVTFAVTDSALPPKVLMIRLTVR